MTAAELTARLVQRVDDDPAVPATVTQAEALAAINEAQELAAWMTLCLETTADWTIPASLPFFSLRASFPDFLVPLRLEIDGARVKPATLAELDARNDQWQTTAGTPEHYCTLGFNLAAATPQPVSDTVARLTYARSPVRMVADDFVETPPAYDASLIDYAIYRVRLKEGAQGLARGVKYLNRALDAWTELGDAVRARSRAARYDVLPFELKLFDRSRLVAAIATAGRRKKP